jgi:hypothetical protein
MEFGFSSSEYVTTSTFWLTLSLLNAGLAQAKKRPGLRWWLISLLIGPFATLLLVVWPPGDYTGEEWGWHTTWEQFGLIVAALVLVGLGIWAFVSFTN